MINIQQSKSIQTSINKQSQRKKVSKLNLLIAIIVQIRTKGIIT